MTAALASGKQTVSDTSENASPQQVTQGTSVSASVRHGDIPSLDAEQPVHSEAIEDLNSKEDASKVTLVCLWLVFVFTVLYSGGSKLYGFLIMDRIQIM